MATKTLYPEIKTANIAASGLNNGMITIEPDVDTATGVKSLAYRDEDGTVRKVLTTDTLTTKGDLLAYGTDTTRLPVGTDGQILTADSAEPTGYKWGSSGTGLDATSLHGIPILDTMPAGALANLYFLIVMWYQNLIAYSQDMSQWTQIRVETPALSGTSTPDGVPYWNIISSIDLNNHRVTQNYTALSTVTTVVLCIKNGSTNGWVLLNKSGVSTYLDLATGIVGSDTATDTQIEACGTGWRVYWQVVDVAGATNLNFYPAESDGDFTFAGDGTSVDFEVTQVQVIDGDIAHAKTLIYAPTTSIADAGTQKYTPTLITDITGA